MSATAMGGRQSHEYHATPAQAAAQTPPTHGNRYFIFGMFEWVRQDTDYIEQAWTMAIQA